MVIFHSTNCAFQQVHVRLNYFYGLSSFRRIAYFWDERWKPGNLIHVLLGPVPLKCSRSNIYNLNESVLPLKCVHVRILPSVLHIKGVYQYNAAVF